MKKRQSQITTVNKAYHLRSYIKHSTLFSFHIQIIRNLYQPFNSLGAEETKHGRPGYPQGGYDSTILLPGICKAGGYILKVNSQEQVH